MGFMNYGSMPNRVVTLGRVQAPQRAVSPVQPAFASPAAPQAAGPSLAAPPPRTAGPSLAASPFATQLAAQKLGGGSFDFRRPTGPVGMAGANGRTMGQASRTPNAYSGTAFGGYTGKTTMNPTGQYSRLKVLGGGSRGGGMG